MIRTPRTTPPTDGPPAAQAVGEPALDWEQLGLPIAVIAADGQLQRANRALRMLLMSTVAGSETTPLDWLSRFTADARAQIFTALADRRTAVAPLAWVGARTDQPRWFAVSLRWRRTGTHCIAVFHDVTLLRQAELAARDQTEQLTALVNTLPTLLAYLDAPSLRCLYANRPFAQAFGLDEDAVLGRALADIVGADRARGVQAGVDQLRSTRSRVESDLGPIDGTTQDDSAPCYTLVLTPHFDPHGELRGIFAQLDDVARQQQFDRAMAESEQRLARFLQAAEEGMLLQQGGRILDANPALCALLGYSLHELIGRSLLELVPSQQRAQWAAAIDGKGPQRFESLLTRRDGSTTPVEFIARAAEDVDPAQMLVLRDIRDRQAAQARMHYLAHHDALTGLPNRQAFLAQLDHLMVAARASRTQLGLLFIDLDHFKRVNESLGHAAGDGQLKTIAQRIGEHVRSTDRVARFGGDEFMVLLPGLRDHGDALQVAHKLLSAIATPITIEARPISVTASIGVAMYPRDAEVPDLLIKHADAAMHLAKSRGRATLAEFEPSIAASAYANIVLEGQLGHAVENQEFALLFQPQVRAIDGVVCGAEALIRWRHPERGLLAPDEFIALAEQHRLMLPIGEWVLREASRFAQRWATETDGQALSLAVNLSAMQFQTEGFIESVEQVLKDSSLPPGWLELELTERMLMDDLPQTQARLQHLRALGVKLSVDDFGTGYSSLAQLKLLPIDKMKIDRSFVQSLPGDRASAAIAGAIVQLARGLGLVAVAEGVETPAQATFLANLGCHQLQGLGISAPLDADAFLAWRARRQATP